MLGEAWRYLSMSPSNSGCQLSCSDSSNSSSRADSSFAKSLRSQIGHGLAVLEIVPPADFSSSFQARNSQSFLINPSFDTGRYLVGSFRVSKSVFFVVLFLLHWQKTVQQHSFGIPVWAFRMILQSPFKACLSNKVQDDHFEKTLQGMQSLITTLPLMVIYNDVSTSSLNIFEPCKLRKWIIRKTYNSSSSEKHSEGRAWEQLEQFSQWALPKLSGESMESQYPLRLPTPGSGQMISIDHMESRPSLDGWRNCGIVE